jgi:hypothetical protein
MSQGYQQRDAAVVDYELWRPPGCVDWLRGPPPPSLAPGSYFACVGAAQTFGCFAARPWPAIVAEQIGLPALNLGVAGAGPEVFHQDAFPQLLAGARFVVFQVMSGRSADCSRFISEGRERLRVRKDDRVLGADAAWSEVLREEHGEQPGRLHMLADRCYSPFGHHEARRLVRETRENWLQQFCSLLDATKAPKLLMWFSRRSPRYRARYHSVNAMFGEFPQLVDERMVATVAAHATGQARCVTSRGTPQLLRDRFTDLPITVSPGDAGSGESADVRWTHNTYYPSPEMHEDAARAVVTALGRLQGKEPLFRSVQTGS